MYGNLLNPELISPVEVKKEKRVLGGKIDPSAYVNTIIADSVAKARSNSDIITLFPDIEDAADIFVATVLNPQSFTSTKLVTSYNSVWTCGNLAKAYLSIVDDAKEELNIVEELDDIVKDAMLGTGGTLKIILPKTAIDGVINQAYDLSDSSITLESYQRTTNYKPPKTMFDDIILAKSDSDIVVTSNLDELKMASALDTMADNVTAAKMMALESHAGGVLNVDKEDNYVIAPEVIKKLMTNGLDINPIKDGRGATRITKFSAAADLESVNGNTLIQTIKSTSFVVIHKPGNPDKPIGYLIALDKKGYPVAKVKKKSRKSTLDEGMSAEDVISKASKSLNRILKNTTDLSKARDLYIDVISDDIKRNLSSSLGYAGLEAKFSTDVAEVIFTSALQDQSIKLLYIPAALATYYTLEVRENGMGVSKLEKLMPMLSMRAAAEVSDVMAEVKNNIGRTNIDVTLDPDTPSLSKAMNEILGVISKGSKLNNLAGFHNITDLTDWLYKLGYEVHFTNHPDLPETEIRYEVVKTDRPVSDSDVKERLEKQTIRGMGILPSMLEDGFGSDFASTDEANRTLFAKRITRVQLRLNRRNTDFIIKYVLNNQSYVSRLRDAYDNHITEVKALIKGTKLKPKTAFTVITRALLGDMVITLPELDTKTILLKDQYEDQADLVESIVEDIYLTPDIFGDMYDDLITNDVSLDGIKSTIKGYIMREWMNKQGFMDSLGIINDDTINADSLAELLENSNSPLRELARKMAKRAMKAKIKYEKQNDGEDDEDSDTGLDGEDDTTTDDGEGDDVMDLEDIEGGDE